MGFWPAFFMCLAAGLATGIGSLAFLIGKGNEKFLACTLGFSAGVMIYVSFTEILQKARQNLTVEFDILKGNVLTVVWFFCGIAFVLLVDLVFDGFQKRRDKKTRRNDEELKQSQSNSIEQSACDREFSDNINKKDKRNGELLKTGFLTAIALAIHNFPEGFATFISAYYEPTLAVTVVMAIALHNIPEGIAVSIPIYFATGNKKKAFLVSFLSGLAEPAGALVGYFILFHLFGGALRGVLYGILFASVAGMMVCLCVKELLPSANEYNRKYAGAGFIVGMLVIAVSLLLFL